MTTQHTFKTCNNCGFKTFNMLKRRCPGVTRACSPTRNDNPLRRGKHIIACWTRHTETTEEADTREARNAKREQFMEDLLAGRI